ncbi:MAG: glycoside hydrolase family 3 C-terminal domain-containing protein, partial [Blastocatellia bacterium]
PYLVSRMGVACITGLQGSVPGIDQTHVMSTAKHFIHGQQEGGTNIAPSNVSERVLRESYLVPFEAAVKEAHVMSVMPSYNEVNGVPMHANAHYLQGLLRQEWGFQGLLVSDYYAIPQLESNHHLVATEPEAAKVALEAGVDIELPDSQTYGTLVEQVKDGRIAMSTLDAAVAAVLRAKFLTGLFEHPYVDPDYAEKICNNEEHQKLALEAARESITLLKNQDNLLPFDRSKLKTIAVIGPNADKLHLGGYSEDPGRGVTMLQGIKDRAGNGVNVVFSKGVKITADDMDWRGWSKDAVEIADPAENAKLIASAVQVAKTADVIVLALGDNEQTCREAYADNHLGDRDSLDLLGQQDDLVKAMLATGKPVVALIMGGRPLSINYVAEHVPAILQLWYLGEEGGDAVGDVLFGEYNPGGKLPITIPRSVGQLPDYYCQKPTARRGYLFTSKEPLFPFGFGLSYTTFKYGEPRLAAEKIGLEGRTTVSIDVTNTGSKPGDEVVQMYIRDEVSSVTRPVKELKGFQRISLKPGETKTVSFDITSDKLAFYNLNMNRVVEPGVFDIMVGPSSVNLKT